MFPISTIAGESDVKAFQAIYDEWHVVLGQRDHDKMLAFLAPNFVSIDLSDKTETAGKMLTDIESVPKTAEPRPRMTTVLSAFGDGKVEQVEQSYHHIKVVTDGAGVQTRLEFNTRSHDTWEFIGGKWLLKSTRTDEVETKMDGVEILHQKRPAT